MDLNFAYIHRYGPSSGEFIGVVRQGYLPLWNDGLQNRGSHLNVTIGAFKEQQNIAEAHNGLVCVLLQTEQVDLWRIPLPYLFTRKEFRIPNLVLCHRELQKVGYEIFIFDEKTLCFQTRSLSCDGYYSNLQNNIVRALNGMTSKQAHSILRRSIVTLGINTP